MDFGQRGIILTLGEVRSFIRKPYIHSWAVLARDYIVPMNYRETGQQHMARKLPSLLTFVVGVALVGVGSVCIVLRPPLGLFILLFGVVFLVIGGLTLLFHASGVKLRAHHVIENAVGLLFILFAMFLVFDNSPAVPMTLVTGMVFLVLGCFPWAYKLPSYVALAIGGTLLAAAGLAGVYVPLIIGHGFVDGETPGFLIHLINFTLGVPGIVLILAGVARFFRWLLFKTSTQLESADGSKSLLKPKRNQNL